MYLYRYSVEHSMTFDLFFCFTGKTAQLCVHFDSVGRREAEEIVVREREIILRDNATKATIAVKAHAQYQSQSSNEGRLNRLGRSLTNGRPDRPISLSRVQGKDANVVKGMKDMKENVDDNRIKSNKAASLRQFPNIPAPLMLVVCPATVLQHWVVELHRW